VTLHELARNGLPLDVFVMDEHCHIGMYANQYLNCDGLPRIVRMMDRLGIDMAVISHMAALSADFAWGNDEVIKAIDAYPGRFYGYCTINPLYPDEIRGELERCFRHPGIKGIKLHPWMHERPLSHKNYYRAYEFAQSYGCPVMSHTYSPEDVMHTGVLAREFPDASFIMAHAGGEVPFIEMAIDVLNAHDNVYADVAVSDAFEGFVEWLVRETSPKKILFGTDMNCMDPTATLSRVAMAEISEDDKRGILGLNMQKILNRIK